MNILANAQLDMRVKIVKRRFFLTGRCAQICVVDMDIVEVMKQVAFVIVMKDGVVQQKIVLKVYQLWHVADLLMVKLKTNHNVLITENVLIVHVNALMDSKASFVETRKWLSRPKFATLVRPGFTLATALDL